MHGVKDLYNEQKWLNDYNTATNQYYDKAVATQQDLRNSYAVNNGQYLDKTLYDKSLKDKSFMCY